MCAFATLMSRAAAGDEAAFAALYDRIAAPVYAMAQSVISDDGGAQRATRDAFVEMWQTAATCPAGDDETLAWAMGVAARRVARHPTIPVDPTPVDDTPGSADLRGALRSLSVGQRECLLLAVHGWLSVGQTAPLVGRRPDVVAGLIRDGLVRLRH